MIAALTVFGLAACNREQAPAQEKAGPPALPEPAPSESAPLEPNNQAPSEPAGLAERGAPSPGGMGQAGAGDPGAPELPVAPGDAARLVSQTELGTFMAIQKKLAIIQEQQAQKAQAGADPQGLQRQLREQAVQIVQASELSPERFTEIARMVQRDPSLQQRVQAGMEGPAKEN